MILFPCKQVGLAGAAVAACHSRFGARSRQGSGGRGSGRGSGLALDLRRRLVEAQSVFESHEKERDALTAGLPPDARTFYERMRKSLGSGTSAVKARACSACQRDVPYETINRSIAGELQTCSYCQRILVVVPDE